jgi:hypothetical protein
MLNGLMCKALVCIPILVHLDVVCVFLLHPDCWMDQGVQHNLCDPSFAAFLCNFLSFYIHRCYFLHPQFFMYFTSSIAIIDYFLVSTTAFLHPLDQIWGMGWASDVIYTEKVFCVFFELADNRCGCILYVIRTHIFCSRHELATGQGSSKEKVVRCLCFHGKKWHGRKRGETDLFYFWNGRDVGIIFFLYLGGASCKTKQCLSTV